MWQIHEDDAYLLMVDDVGVKPLCERLSKSAAGGIRKARHLSPGWIVYRDVDMLERTPVPSIVNERE